MTAEMRILALADRLSRASGIGTDPLDADALIERAIDDQIRTATVCAPLIIERGPFPEHSSRIEIDVKVGTGPRGVLVSHSMNIPRFADQGG